MIGTSTIKIHCQHSFNNILEQQSGRKSRTRSRDQKSVLRNSALSQPRSRANILQTKASLFSTGLQITGEKRSDSGLFAFVQSTSYPGAWEGLVGGNGFDGRIGWVLKLGIGLGMGVQRIEYCAEFFLEWSYILQFQCMWVVDLYWLEWTHFILGTLVVRSVGIASAGIRTL